MHYRVDGISHRGEGVVRIEGKACFVPFAIPGETIALDITEEHQNYLRGELREIIEAFPQRCVPPCPHFYQCGGCDWQHLDYSRQLDFKREIIVQQMKRIAKMEAEVKPVIGMESPWHYRNKVSWNCDHLDDGTLALGYYRRNRQALIPLQDCRIIPTVMLAIGKWLNDHIEDCGLAAGDRVELRQSNVDDSLLMVIVGQPDEAFLLAYLPNAFSQLSSICIATGEIHYAILGDPWQMQDLAGCSFRISADSFFQVNSTQAEALYHEVAALIAVQPPLRIIDAYCGAGTITCMLAKKGHRLLGVEANQLAVGDARHNRKLNHIAKQQCRFICGPCEVEMPPLLEGVDLLILDPPRAGCHPHLIQALTEQTVSQVIYVSCDPATLARDLGRLNMAGYRLQSLQPVDMFAHTGHVEVVAALTCEERP